MNEMLFVWLFGSLALVIAETINPGLFYFLGVACGGCAAMLAAWCGEPIDMQFVIFVLASFLSVTMLRLVLSNMSAHLENRTNVYALEGRDAVVMQDIQPHAKGYVRIDGEWWPAQEKNNIYVAKHTVVEVLRVVGCHVVVEINTNT
jgi:membrane protein implicated in regulation of membrane protease activity